MELLRKATKSNNLLFNKPSSQSIKISTQPNRIELTPMDKLTVLVSRQNATQIQNGIQQGTPETAEMHCCGPFAAI